MRPRGCTKPLWLSRTPVNEAAPNHSGYLAQVISIPFNVWAKLEGLQEQQSSRGAAAGWVAECMPARLPALLQLA